MTNSVIAFSPFRLLHKIEQIFAIKRYKAL